MYKFVSIFILTSIFGLTFGLTSAYSSEALSKGQNNNNKVKKTQDFVPHELLVKFKSSNAKSAMIKYGADEKKSFRASGAKLLRFSSVIDLEKTMEALRKDGNVEYVEHNTIYKLLAVPNDDSYGRLYGMESMSMHEAWNKNTGSKNVLVGVIDTGIDWAHVDLKDNYWANPGETGLDADGNDKTTNGIDDDNNGYVDDHRGWDFINGDNDPMDGHGHGTHCAGSIGAVGNNGVGVAGVNWSVSLVGLKIFSDAGSTTTEAITEAIEYSTRIGVDVTNNSWGGGEPSETIRAAISEANDAQILFIAAAGNSSANNDTGSFFPSNYELENIVAVAAVDSGDKLAGFSNYGKTKVHVAAPGVNIYSTKPGGGYQSMSGTSMAAPHITGLAAFIKAQFPNDSMARIRRRIIYTGDSITALSSKLISGKRANGFSALQNDEVAPAKVEGLEIVESLMSSVEIAFKTSGDDGFSGEASEYEIKISDKAITPENWSAATKVSLSSLVVAEGSVSLSIEGLDLNSAGFVAVRASDDLGNQSEISDSVEFATLEVEILAENSADSLDDVTVEGTWGLETTEDGNSMFSDSPEGNYGGASNMSLTMSPMRASSEKTFLMLKTQYDLEATYDFGHVEVSTDEGETWVEAALLTGKSGGFISSVINLSDAINGAESFQVRFRLTSDNSVSRDGWKIDSITVLGGL